MRSAKVNGARVKAIREERELTQAELAAKIQTQHGRTVSPYMLSKIELGQREPSAQLFGALCRALEVDRTVLLREADAA